MVMPIPSRSQNHVTPLHLDAFPVDGGKAAFAFDDESHGEGSVSMRGSCFVGHDELESGI
jgi:hypothetical protein